MRTVSSDAALWQGEKKKKKKSWTEKSVCFGVCLF